MTQNHSHLIRIFKDYDPEIQKLLRQVLKIEQEYITDPLTRNSLTHKELRDKIDRVLEELTKV